MRYWRQLHSGESVFVDGKEITTDMVTDAARAPIKITYMTDTVAFDAERGVMPLSAASCTR